MAAAESPAQLDDSLRPFRDEMLKALTQVHIRINDVARVAFRADDRAASSTDSPERPPIIIDFQALD